MNKKRLEQNLAAWRGARRIAEHSSASAQYNCYTEERAELMDAIGDCVVTLLNTQALSSNFWQIASCELQIMRIRMSAWVAGVDFNECLRMAWGEIENRIGLTRSSGKFTKWRDLTHDERLIVAKSGQLSIAPDQIVRGAKLYCTPEEWAEVLIAATVTDAERHCTQDKWAESW
jgi:hypothetical protein